MNRIPARLINQNPGAIPAPSDRWQHLLTDDHCRTYFAMGFGLGDCRCPLGTCMEDRAAKDSSRDQKRQGSQSLTLPLTPPSR